MFQLQRDNIPNPKMCVLYFFLNISLTLSQCHNFNVNLALKWQLSGKKHLVKEGVLPLKGL